MGCVKSRPISIVPGQHQGPSVATVRKHNRHSRLLSLLGVKRQRGKRFTREQRQLIKKYLPSIPIYEHSMPLHLACAGQHWGEVYKEGSQSGMSKRSQGSWGRETKQSSTLRELYDSFYAYLEEHSPDLMPVFRSSLQVRGKVLVHISAGMRSLLTSQDALGKVAQLAQTHLRVGVQLEHFDPLARALLYAMEKTSGSLWTPEVDEAWRRLFVHCSALLMVEQKRAAAQALKSGRSTSHLPPTMSDGFRTPKGNSIREQSSSRIQSSGRQ